MKHDSTCAHPTAALTPAAPPKAKTAERTWLDRLGATGSILCAIHCALGPFLIAVIPALAARWFDSRLEYAVAAFVTVLGLSSLYLGWRRHRALRALGFMVTGLALIWSGILLPVFHDHVVRHAVMMAIGGTLVAVGHLLNLRLNHGHVHDASCSH